MPYLHEPIEMILEKKEAELEALIKRMNYRIKNRENQDIKIAGTGEKLSWHLVYRNDEEPLDHPLYAQLPQMSIIDILMFVHRQINCFSAFIHLVDCYAKQATEVQHIAACLVAFGENTGLYKMAAIPDILYKT